MINDVMVQLDGTPADEIRLAQAAGLAKSFEGYVVGLFLNLLPFPELLEAGYASVQSADLIEKARQMGDKTQEIIAERLEALGQPTELRRFDVFWDDISPTAGHEAMTADTFITLGPDRQRPEREAVIEGVLFGSGRHVIMLPGDAPARTGFDSILVAWNGRREAARALGESLPYLAAAKTVVVVAVDAPGDSVQPMGSDVVRHLSHHGISAVLHQVKSRGGDIAATLLDEASERGSDLIVMGGYGHSRLREWLLGGVTHKLMHGSPIPLLLAH
jgi:nucleotide-binding universal stress UspA family protein